MEEPRDRIERRLADLSSDGLGARGTETPWTAWLATVAAACIEEVLGVRLYPQVRAEIEMRRVAFVSRHGREPGPSDPLFPDGDTNGVRGLHRGPSTLESTAKREGVADDRTSRRCGSPHDGSGNGAGPVTGSREPVTGPYR